MPRALLLDLDDTVLAFDSVADDCWRALCRRFAPELDGVDAEELFLVLDQSRDWYWRDAERHRRGRTDLEAARRLIVRHAFETSGRPELDVAERLADTYTEERELAVQPFPGAIETLAELRRRGLPLALVTNGQASFQRAKIERFDLAQYFECIVVEGEFGAGKPDPSVFLHALGALGCPPAEAWMVGDSLVYDIAPAQSLGMTGVWVDSKRAGPGATAECAPARTIGTLAELVLLLDG